MDYFFCCFGTNDDDQSPQSLLIKEHVLSKSPKPVIYRRPFLPLQITREDHSACKDSENSFSDMLLGGNEERKLNIEAGLVKCGTLTKTPDKTRNLCGKSKDSCPSSEDLENTFTQSVNLEQQAENPMTPTEDWIREPGRNKYVHFKGKCNEIPSFSSGPDSTSDLRQSTPLPYPTPLKLTDEMQTPGTAFPTTFETLKNRKYHHIRSQYVYPVPNLHQSKSLKVAGSHSNQMTKSLYMAGMHSPYEKETGVLISVKEKLKPTKDRKGCVDETPVAAADWNEEEFCSISPRWLDRNGIQNKHMEDQNVNRQSNHLR